MFKSWVIVRFTKTHGGAVKVWRDYEETWGSSIYTVIGYFDGTYRDALKYARTLGFPSKDI